MTYGEREWLKMGEAARELHVSYNTMLSYVHRGLVKTSLTPGGQYTISRAELRRFKGEPLKQDETPRRVFYTRVSNQQGDTTAQEDRLRRAYGEPERVYSDRASGLNENRPGLKRLIRDARNGKFTEVCITARERLTRFGYSYLMEFFHDHDITVTVLDDQRQDKDLHEELLRDFMSLLASFSGKYYKLRSLKHEQMLLDAASRELVSNEA